MAAFQNVAPVKWAQRADSLYLTISLADVTNEKLELTETGLTFSGTSGGKEYGCTLAFVSIYLITLAFLLCAFC
jgi:cytosolic prostaglandin-E synthase